MGRYPFPVPFGWFQVGYGDELPVAAVRPLYYFDRHLVLWRDHGGVAHLHDAFCPHLGAHLGHGGIVDGTCIVCPLHGRGFDGSGTCGTVPGQAGGDPEARLRCYPLVERNGALLAWYHPRHEPPGWDVPEVPEFAAGAPGPTGGPTAELRVRTRYVIDACLQEITENGYDSAHLPHVHGTSAAHEVEFRDVGDHRAWIATSLRYATARGDVANHVTSESWGPGVGLVHFGGVVDTLILGTTAPITAERSELHFSYLFRTSGEPAGLAVAARSFLAEIERQYRQDVVIWEHKAYLERPALSDAEALIPRFRRWFGQFYAEPVPEHDGGRHLPPPPLG